MMQVIAKNKLLKSMRIAFLIIVWILIAFVLISVPMLDIFISPVWVFLGVTTMISGLMRLFPNPTSIHWGIAVIVIFLLTPIVWFSLFLGYGEYNSFRNQAVLNDFITTMTNEGISPNGYKVSGQLPTEFLKDVSSSYEIVAEDTFFWSYDFIVRFESGVKYRFEIGNKCLFIFGNCNEWSLHVSKR